MKNSDYAESVTHALRRVHYLLDGVRHGVDREQKEVAALQSYLVHELRKLRHQLWDYRHDAHLYRALDQLEKAEVAIRGRLFEDAFLHMNSAYALMSRLAVRTDNLTEEMESISNDTWSVGVSSGLMTGFLLGISVFIFQIILRVIGY
ncbi:MAG: hypothetical protein ABH829_00035 [archaeon]